MEERTSLITLLAIANVSRWPQINGSLENGYPSNLGMQYFTVAPHVQEGAELTESTEVTDHGRLVTYNVRANLYRESTIAEAFRNKDVIVYIETLNGERYLLGKGDNPMRITYTRSSGLSITDNNETAVQFVGKYPI